MRRMYCVGAFAAVAVALSLQAQRVDVVASVAISVTRVNAAGAAQYYTSTGTQAPQAISGFLSLFEESYDVSDLPWQGWNGAWNGSFFYTGDYDLCYVAGIDGHAVNTSVTTSYSNTACTGPPPSNPPYFHGYDICPLILDLDGDGIPTTGLEDVVSFFDTNHDGIREASGWTSPYARDAFLWMDINGNGRPDPGELFGAGMPMPEGGYARNGFQALALYDDPEYGVTATDRSRATTRSGTGSVCGSIRTMTASPNRTRSRRLAVSTSSASISPTRRYIAS